MKSLMFQAVEWFAKGGVPAFLASSGMTMVVFAGIDLAVQSAMDNIVATLNSVEGDLLQLVLLSGVGEAISLIGSAILTRVALLQASNVLGLGKATT